MDWMDEVAEKMRRRNQILFSRDSAVLQPLSASLANVQRRAAVLWALDLAEEIAEGISRAHPEDGRPRRAVQAARQWASGSIRMPIAQRAILDCHAAAREAASPADAARLHAVAQGCSVVHTVGHALGLPIYELTALVREHGLKDSRKAVELRVLEYVDRLCRWQTQAAKAAGPWADFLK